MRNQSSMGKLKIPLNFWEKSCRNGRFYGDTQNHLKGVAILIHLKLIIGVLIK